MLFTDASIPKKKVEIEVRDVVTEERTQKGTLYSLSPKAADGLRDEGEAAGVKVSDQPWEPLVA